MVGGFFDSSNHLLFYLLQLVGLPEVCIESCAETYYDEGTYDVEPIPTITDGLLEVLGEGDCLYLFLAWSWGEAANHYHEDEEEHEQPALEHEPVGLPEP